MNLPTLFRRQEFWLLVALALVLATFGALSQHTHGEQRFLTSGNFIKVAQQISIRTVIAVGMTLVILSGGIDLSVGSIVAVSGLVATGVMAEPLWSEVGGARVPQPGSAWIACGADWRVGLLAGLLAGAAMGAASGAAVAWLRVPSFIATLAMLTIGQGVARAVSQSFPVTKYAHEGFDWIGSGALTIGSVEVPWPVVFMAVVWSVATWTLARTSFGRQVYALGGNAEAARLAGVNVARLRWMLFTLSGTLAAFAGLMEAGKSQSGQPTAGEGYELQVIAAVVLGGTRLEGGSGSLVGTLLGSFIIGFLQDGLRHLGVTDAWQRIVIGGVIFGAVLLQRVRTRET